MLFEQKDLDVAKSLYGDDIEKSERFARSIHKLRESRKKYDDKREKYKIKFIDTVPEQKLNISQKMTFKEASTFLTDLVLVKFGINERLGQIIYIYADL